MGSFARTGPSGRDAGYSAASTGFPAGPCLSGFLPNGQLFRSRNRETAARLIMPAVYAGVQTGTTLPESLSLSYNAKSASVRRMPAVRKRLKAPHALARPAKEASVPACVCITRPAAFLFVASPSSPSPPCSGIIFVPVQGDFFVNVNFEVDPKSWA